MAYNPNLYNTGVFKAQGYQSPNQDISGAYQTPSYPQSSSGLQDAGSVVSAGGDEAMATGNPYAMIGGAAAKGVGTALDFYGKYEAREQARRDQDEAMARYNEAKRVEEEDRQREIQRQGRQEGYFGGDYAQGLEDRFSGSYGGYRQGGQ